MATWVNVQVQGGIDATEVASHQYSLLRSKINMLPQIDMQSATALSKNIQNVKLPGWSSAQVAQLCTDVGQKSEGMGGDEHKYQECTTFDAYLTKAEYDKLCSGELSDNAMVAVCKKRAHLIGLVKASEGTKGHIANIIKHASRRDDMPAREWYKLLQKVKEALSSIKAFGLN